ncbi:MAG: hypothetical protein P8102_12835 [Gammaproteobacteria bacterium]
MDVTPMTGNHRRDAVTEALVTRMRAASGFRYDYRAGVPGSRGIGTTADWAAWTYQVPSWTLELEPRNGGQDYGGTGASHSGFILPEFRAEPMREEVSRMLFAGAWRQAGPPSLRAAEIRDADGQVVYAARWRRAGDRRVLDVTRSTALLPGREYRLWLAFDRPMRWRDSAGALADYPGQAVAAVPRVEIQAPGLPGASDLVLDPGDLAWLDQPGGAPAGYRDYRDDALSGNFTAPVAWDTGAAVPLVITVQARDFLQAALDADPSTPVGWAGGAWTGYEDASGASGDSGGVDCSFTPYAGAADAAAPDPAPCRESGAIPPSGGGGSGDNGGGGSAGLLLPFVAWWLSRRRPTE